MQHRPPYPPQPPYRRRQYEFFDPRRFIGTTIGKIWLMMALVTLGSGAILSVMAIVMFIALISGQFVGAIGQNSLVLSQSFAELVRLLP